MYICEYKIWDMENKRHDELSDKLFKLGRALNKEGQENGDYVISATGDVLILASGLLFDIDDMKSFTDLCSMFSSKKLIDRYMSNSNIAGMRDNELDDVLREIKDNLDIDFGKYGEDFDDEDFDDEPKGE